MHARACVFRACVGIYRGVCRCVRVVYRCVYGYVSVDTGALSFYTGRFCIVGYCCVCLFLSVCVYLSVCETSAHSSRAGHLGDYELALLEENTHGTQL
jgi:hypothetical protein